MIMKNKDTKLFKKTIHEVFLKQILEVVNYLTLFY